MSGYNADYTAPRDNETEEATPAPIELVEEPKPYAPWDTGTFANIEELDKARLLATVRELQKNANKPIQADDHRIAHIWESAGEIADQKGYCDVFDTFMDELGTGFTREMEYCVTVTETVTYDVHVTAPRNATQEDIEERVEDMDLDDWSETDRDREVVNYESAE